MITGRLNKELYLMAIARTAALRSTCPRRSVGAVLALDGRILTTGYNGAPSGMTSCLERGSCVMYEDHCINTVHAEINTLRGIAKVGDLLVSTDAPCLGCYKAILAHNPKIQIRYWRDYDDPARDEFRRAHGLHRRGSGHSMQAFTVSDMKRVEEFLRNA